jgi:FixJ family two-component response regulator
VAVVEDDESLRRAVARLLAASGYHPVGYHSAEALLADSNRPTFQCLVVDIQLGGISGLELKERLAASGSTTPVVFLTAQESAEGRHRALQAHCAGVLRKSEPGAVLLTAIDGAIHASNRGQKP